MNTYHIEEKLSGAQLCRMYRKHEYFVLAFENGMDQYILHILCFWRMLRQPDRQILFTKEDIYSEASHRTVQNDLGGKSEFDWDEEGSNRMDEIVTQLGNKYQTLHVKNVQISKYADLIIEFAEGMVLQALVDAMLPNMEQWYFWTVPEKCSHETAYPSRVVHDQK